MPDRLDRVAIVSGAAPPDMSRRLQGVWFPIKLLYGAARVFPPLFRLALLHMGKAYADPEKFTEMVEKGLPEPDRDLAERRPELFRIYSRSARGAHRNGVVGDYWEWQLYARRPWDSRLEAIRVPIQLWNGKVDGMVPLAMGQYLHEKPSRSTLTVVPDGGHFKTINNCRGNVLEYLVR